MAQVDLPLMSDSPRDAQECGPASVFQEESPAGVEVANVTFNTRYPAV